MTFSTITYDRAGDVGVIRLNQPETLNAMNAQMFDELSAAVDMGAADARALLLSSSGRGFSSGANLGALGSAGLPDPGDLLETRVNPLIEMLMTLPIPWVSAVRGPAAGVGCSLALAADIVVASESAYFLLAFSAIGLVPDGGASWLLNRAVGRARALELMLLAEKLEARRALEWGLISRVVPDAELDDAALALAARLAAGPTKAYGLIRRIATEAADGTFRETLALECQSQREASASADAAEGIAAFVEKRRPNFSGR